MDGHLRLILLIVAAIIVSFILLESWFRRRQSKQAQLSTDNKAHISITADEVLGLDADEPTMNLVASSVDDRSSAENAHYIQQNAASRMNASYANKTYPTSNSASSVNAKPDASKHPISFLNDLLVLSVVAPDAEQFGSYDLLQAIATTGMQFGEMNIFHYKVGNETLFSLSSATEPGDFNLDRMGDFSCEGLTLFANLRAVSNPEKVFDLMLNAAEQLAEDLGGELRAGTRRPWNNDAYQAYRNKVMQYQPVKSV